MARKDYKIRSAGEFDRVRELILKNGQDRGAKLMQESLARVAKEAKDNLANKSAQLFKASRRGHPYAKGWRVSIEDGQAVIHNKEYRLVHLLEHGHIVRNQYRVSGYARGRTHVRTVQEEANEKITEEVKKIWSDKAWEN